MATEMAGAASMPSMPKVPGVPGMLSVPGTNQAAQQQQQDMNGSSANGWGLWNIVKDAAAAVTPSGQPPGAFGAAMANGHPQAIGYTPNTTPPVGPEVKLPHGKRLAYRMDYTLKEAGNSYIAAITSHTAYWASKDVAYFIMCKIYPELEQLQIPPNLQNF